MLYSSAEIHQVELDRACHLKLVNGTRCPRQYGGAVVTACTDHRFAAVDEFAKMIEQGAPGMVRADSMKDRNWAGCPPVDVTTCRSDTTGGSQLRARVSVSGDVAVQCSGQYYDAANYIAGSELFHLHACLDRSVMFMVEGIEHGLAQSFGRTVAGRI